MSNHYPDRVGNFWHFSDGTVLPVVSGGSDTQTDAPAGEPAPLPDPPRTTTGQFAPRAATPEPVTVGGQPVRTFTEADIEAARTQERDKLYGTIDGLKGTVEELKAAQDERDRLAAEAQAEAERLAEEKRMAELDAKTAVAEVEEKFTRRLTELEERAERDRLLFEKEREFAELQQYRQQAMATRAADILPELLEYIDGSTREDIDAALDRAAAKTDEILNNIAGAGQATRQQQRGANITAPPVGPMDTQTDYQSISSQEIADMSISEYAQRRQQLLGGASRHVSERGLYD